MKEYIDQNYKDIIEETLKKLHLKDHTSDYEIVWDENDEATFKLTKSLKIEAGSLKSGEVVRKANVKDKVVLGIVISAKENSFISAFIQKNSSGLNISLSTSLEDLYIASETVKTLFPKEVEKLNSLRDSASAFEKLFE